MTSSTLATVVTDSIASFWSYLTPLLSPLVVFAIVVGLLFAGIRLVTRHRGSIGRVR